MKIKVAFLKKGSYIKGVLGKTIRNKRILNMMTTKEFGTLFTQTAIALGYNQYSDVDRNVLMVRRYTDKNKNSRRLSFKFITNDRLPILQYMIENKVLGEGWYLLINNTPETLCSIGVCKKLPLD
jgi:hypothetical protein